MTFFYYYYYTSLDIKPENLLLRRIPRSDSADAQAGKPHVPSTPAVGKVQVYHKRRTRQNDTDTEEIVALADFGLAIQDENETFDICVGTPAYWAPEMLRREKFGLAVDIWALGCVLYILLCGVHPFDPSGDSPEAQILARVATGDYDKSSKEYRNLSEAAKDLMRHLLDSDPKRRYTAQQVLEHPWLTTERSREPIHADHVAKLSGFRVLTLIKTGMRDLLHQAEQDLFDELDENGDGFISRDELSKGLKAVGFELSETEIDAFLKLVDTNGDQVISREEFKDVLAKRFDHDLAPTVEHASLEDLATLFKAYDKNGDGYISADDVHHVLTLLGSHTSRSVVQNEWEQLTGDANGLVTFAQFVKYVREIEAQKRKRDEGVAGTSSVLKLRDRRDLLRSKR